jgi:DNA polymerase-4
MAVVHINVIGFYTAVAEVVRPKLKGYPLAVVTAGRSRRMLLDVSRQAVLAGLRRGMLLENATRLCRDLVLLDPTPDLYDRAMNALVDEAGHFSPQVEAAGPGHVFIDLNGTQRLWGASMDAAASLRKAIIEKYRLSPSLGVAKNKLVSKVATRVVRPEGLCQVMAGGEQEFLAPLPVGHLPGVEESIIEELHELNLQVVAEVLSLGLEALTAAFGKAGTSLFKAARGEDNTPVRMMDKPAPCVVEEFTFPGQTNDQEVFRAAMWRVCSRSARKLRNMGLGARRVVLSITYADGQRTRRSGTLPQPTLDEFDLFVVVERFFATAYSRRVRLKALSLRLENLACPSGQLDLFDTDGHRRRLLDSIDEIRERFGEDAIDLAAFRGRFTTEAKRNACRNQEAHAEAQSPRRSKPASSFLCDLRASA